MTHCIATEKRVEWALLRAGATKEWREDVLRDVVAGRLMLDEGREIAEDAGVPFAALFAPDPSRWQMFKAWLHGVFA